MSVPHQSHSGLSNDSVDAPSSSMEHSVCSFVNSSWPSWGLSGQMIARWSRDRLLSSVSTSFSSHRLGDQALGSLLANPSLFPFDRGVSVSLQLPTGYDAYLLAMIYADQDYQFWNCILTASDSVELVAKIANPNLGHHPLPCQSRRGQSSIKGVLYMGGYLYPMPRICLLHDLGDQGTHP